MKKLTGFGLKNFRIFKDYQEFDIRPLTVITGPNNSGKSSLIKALLLSQDNFTFDPDYDKRFAPSSQRFKLNFLDDIHNLSDISLVLNDKTKNMEFLYKYGKFSYCLEFDKKGYLVNHNYKICRSKEEIVIQQNGGDLRLNFKLFLDYIYDYIKDNVEYKEKVQPLLKALNDIIETGKENIAIFIEDDNNGKLQVLYSWDKSKFGKFDSYENFIDTSFLTSVLAPQKVGQDYS